MGTTVPRFQGKTSNNNRSVKSIITFFHVALSMHIMTLQWHSPLSIHILFLPCVENLWIYRQKTQTFFTAQNYVLHKQYPIYYDFHLWIVLFFTWFLCGICRRNMEKLHFNPPHKYQRLFQGFACCECLFIQFARPVFSKHIWWCFDLSKLSISLNTYII